MRRSWRTPKPRARSAYRRRADPGDGCFGLEIIAGLKRDPQFGPVILVGMGGIYVEVFHDVSMRLIPVSRDDIEEMLKETKVIKLIEGARGKVYDKAALIDAVLRLSELAVKRPDIEEIDINPFFLYEEGKGLKGVRRADQGRITNYYHKNKE